MSSVTIFVGAAYKNWGVSKEFIPALGDLLKILTNQQRVDIEESSSPDCTPVVIIAMRDFGGFGDEKMGEIKKEIRKLTRLHFEIADQEISVTMQGTFVL